MAQELDEVLNIQMPLIIVKNWDKTVETLKRQTGLESMALSMGFDLTTLADVATKEFPQNVELVEEHNAKGEKIEDVTVEGMTVKGRPLDRLLVKAYPAAANPEPTAMTQFQFGGEIILVADGEAELTYADKIINGSIAKQDLKTAKVEKGDLIISTNTPNNWTKISGESFSFVYFVANPNGQQKYSEVPKIKIPIK